MFSFTVILAWIRSHWRTLAIIGGILLLFFFFLYLKSCFTKEAKIDEESIQKINKANEKERKEELQKIINENADVIKTVDENNTILNEEIENRQKEIDKKIEEADKKIQEAKSQGKDVTSEELECILIPENCK